MDLDRAVQAARDNHQAVLTTLKSDGLPQISNVVQAVGEDGVIRVSITAGRAKYANLKRKPWAALHVNGPDFWSYAVLECDVVLTAIAAAPDDSVVDELCDLYRQLSGEHDSWSDYRAAMVDDERLVVRLTPTYAYGALR